MFICLRSFRPVDLHSSIEGADTRLDSRVASSRDWSRLDEALRVAERGHTRVRRVAYQGDALGIIAS